METPANSPTSRPTGMKPAAELGAKYAHGVRMRYMAGCRCFHCRRANSDYERQRGIARGQGDWNGFVPALKARRHMQQLTAAGIGKRQVQLATDISNSTLGDIRNGKAKQIRARTERLILAVTVACIADAALVPAGPTWAKIEELIADGYSSRHIGIALGIRYPHVIQFSRGQIFAKHEAQMARVYAKLKNNEAELAACRKRARWKPLNKPVIVHVLEDDDITRDDTTITRPRLSVRAPSRIGANP